VRPIPPSLTVALHRRCRADRWGVSPAEFAAALQASAERMFAGRDPSERDVTRYLSGLHLEDLALAAGCAAGHDTAWDAFIASFRPVLYRTADALDATGGARDLADAIYADLYGIRVRDGRRDSLLRHYHGRSSLATWLRAVLAQRHVDGIRAARRLEPLSEDEPRQDPADRAEPADDPDHGRRIQLVHVALSVALAALDPRDRLRLACYYQRQLTLAETGRILREHEATVSRQLARTRRAIRQSIERELQRSGLSPAEVEEALAAVVSDAGAFDLQQALGKESVPDRSI
jgi:RNA polymerase sigma-70 factor (ECF subfamily)